MMKKTDLEIIQEIEDIRGKNNVNWMDIMRVAIVSEPKETKKLLFRINECDNKINKLLDELTKNWVDHYEGRNKK